MKTRSILFLSLAVLSTSVSAQRIMKVEKTDGTVVEIPVTDVKRVFFEEPEEPDATVQAGLCPDNHHPHMIDLGIGTLWSCCNVGASTPEGYGNYYAWGETSPKSVYNWDTYAYGSSWDNVVNIGSDISGTSYDAARANWGAPWRMPTLAECQKLFNSCSSEWTSVNGVYGRKFTGPNGGSIFLPAAGGRRDGELYDVGDWGLYWSSTPRGEYYAYDLYFDSKYADRGSGYRYLGLTVRPVR